MSIFTIDTDNNITAHLTRKVARQSGAGIFDSAEGLAELIGSDSKRLVEIWNSLTGVRPVKKFSSLAVGARRIFAAVQNLVPAPDKKLTGPKKGATKGRGSRQAALAVSPAAAGKAAGIEKNKNARELKAPNKRETVLSLIGRPRGASVDELMAALGWQKHSVRGFIATLAKTIFIESSKSDEGVRTYRSL
jgi:hypothetical protein